MVQASPKPITLEDFLQLPETKPAREYIDGVIIQKPMPKGEHSALQRELLLYIDPILKSANIARAFPELRCTVGGRSIVPDLTIFLNDRIPRQENGSIANAFWIAPDWTIEILSPGQNLTKVIDNILHCLDHGSDLGWFIDPAEQTVIVYPAQTRSRSFSQPQSVLPVPDWAKGLELTVGQLFGWLLD
jgi:Uma2 family endonuclease